MRCTARSGLECLSLGVRQWCCKPAGRPSKSTRCAEEHEELVSGVKLAVEVWSGVTKREGND